MFLDESGFSMLPVVRRTWGPRGDPPFLWHCGRHRDKVSTTSAITVSPDRRRLGLYIRFYPLRSVQAPDTVAFLRHLLRHLRGQVVVLWDRGRIHRAKITRELLYRYRRRLTVEFFPPYAPELNPDEHVWTHLKYHRLANHGFRELPILHRRLLYHARQIRTDQDLLWSCIEGSQLPLRRS